MADVVERDKQQALNSIMKDLMDLQRSNRSRSSSMSDVHWAKPLDRLTASSPEKVDVRVKFEYNGEKRILQFKRPVKFDDVLYKAEVAFGQPMEMFYSTNDLLVPVRSQEDMTNAVELMDRSSHVKSLRISLLPLRKMQPTSSSPVAFNIGPLQSPAGFADPMDGYFHPKVIGLPFQNQAGRSSPPPGYIPDGQQQMAHHGSYTSVHSEGEFIPDDNCTIDPLMASSPDKSASGSCHSLDSPLGEIHHKSGIPGSQSYPYDQDMQDLDNSPFIEQAGKGGTYPRHFTPSFHQHDCNEGRRTFPRARRAQWNSLLLPFPVSPTSISRSTSSGSSGVFAPEYDDGRFRCVPGDLANATDISPPSRSPRAPTNWRLGKLLGQGAFGRVFLCYDADTGCELAVKQVQYDPDITETTKEVRALECEIQLLKNLHHERIVQYYGCLRDHLERTLSIFMEYMPGVLQEVEPNDGPKRKAFALEMLNRIEYDEDYLNKAMCTEVYFHVSGKVNRHN
uniref:mitogen-activated protein kinase kinase kinase 2-like n=1 Tax=Myxine glutinosa TaxID=7769 RepID=UPI00358FBC35